MKVNQNSLPDFIQKSKELNPNMDFYDFRVGLQIQNVYEALNQYRKRVKDKEIIIPSNFEKLGRGNNVVVKCDVRYKDCRTNYPTFEDTIKSNNIDLAKKRQLVELKTRTKKESIK